MTLFERVFGGNDYNYARTVAAIDEPSLLTAKASLYLSPAPLTACPVTTASPA